MSIKIRIILWLVRRSISLLERQVKMYSRHVESNFSKIRNLEASNESLVCKATSAHTVMQKLQESIIPESV